MCVYWRGIFKECRQEQLHRCRCLWQHCTSLLKSMSSVSWDTGGGIHLSWFLQLSCLLDNYWEVLDLGSLESGHEPDSHFCFLCFVCVSVVSVVWGLSSTSIPFLVPSYSRPVSAIVRRETFCWIWVMEKERKWCIDTAQRRLMKPNHPSWYIDSGIKIASISAFIHVVQKR